MGQAGLYMGVSKNTFKKYAKLHGLWAPIKSSKGITPYWKCWFGIETRLEGILGGKKSKPIQRRYTVKKGIHEGYLKCACSNCSRRLHPYERYDSIATIILDFLDRNPMNTKIENLRVLCFNCVYELASSKKGWYRHRTTVLGDIWMM